MTYKFEIRRKPGRAMHVVADVLLALACFGALQTLGTTATATPAATVDASPTEPAGAFLSVDVPASAEVGRDVHETVVAKVERSPSITAPSVPAALSAH